MLKKRLLIGFALLGFVVVTLGASSPAAMQRGWRGAIDTLLGEGGTHLAIVRGTVQFDATIIAGGDFTVAPTATGKYFVAYTGSPYSDSPTVLVQVLGTDVGPPANCVAYVDAETLVGFDVVTKCDGTQVDHSFKFIAAGPR